MSIVADAHITVGIGYFLRISRIVKPISRPENKKVIIYHMLCRIYGFVDERSEYMEKLSIANFDPNEPYIYPIGSHYTLRREMPVSMNARQFFQEAQEEPLEELLSDLDMGFAPATFIALAFSNLFQLLFFTCPEKTSRRRRYTENGHSKISGRGPHRCKFSVWGQALFR